MFDIQCHHQLHINLFSVVFSWVHILQKKFSGNLTVRIIILMKNIYSDTRLVELNVYRVLGNELCWSGRWHTNSQFSSKILIIIVLSDIKLPKLVQDIYFLVCSLSQNIPCFRQFLKKKTSICPSFHFSAHRQFCFYVVRFK